MDECLLASPDSYVEALIQCLEKGTLREQLKLNEVIGWGARTMGGDPRKHAFSLVWHKPQGEAV